MSAARERRDGTVLLADGRRLGYAEWGATAAAHDAVFDMHGGPGCRLSVSGDVGAIAASGLRWITVDRPGLGESWPCPGRTVASFADDVGQLADDLGVERFHVVGWSMGGPYAAACGAVLGDRVASITLLAPAPVTTPSPTGAEEMGKSFAWVLARDDPWQMAQLYTTLGLEARRNPALALSMFTGAGDGLDDSELQALARPEVQQMFVEMVVEATRQGAVGLVDDMRVELKEWGFDPAKVTSPTTLWQGDKDSFVSTAAAHRWAAALPGLELHILPGEGHLFVFDRTTELVNSIRDHAIKG